MILFQCSLGMGCMDGSIKVVYDRGTDPSLICRWYRGGLVHTEGGRPNSPPESQTRKPRDSYLILWLRTKGQLRPQSFSNYLRLAVPIFSSFPFLYISSTFWDARKKLKLRRPKWLSPHSSLLSPSSSFCISFHFRNPPPRMPLYTHPKVRAHLQSLFLSRSLLLS